MITVLEYVGEMTIDDLVLFSATGRLAQVGVLQLQASSTDKVIHTCRHGQQFPKENY